MPPDKRPTMTDKLGPMQRTLATLFASFAFAILFVGGAVDALIL